MIEPLFLGRQPILDCNHNLVAYELLFRSGDGNSARFENEVAATAAVITHSFVELGSEISLGPYSGYINLGAPLLMSEVIESLPKEKVVFELLETVSLDEALLKRCRALKEMGFRIALDDVSDFGERVQSVIDMADIVKIDASLISAQELPDLIEKIRKYPVRLLAEKVETEEQLDLYQKLGFDLFQGYYFARPHIIRGKRLTHSEVLIMKLLSLITGDADLFEIEEIVKESPLMSYSLLKMANSAARGANAEITSIRSAIILLGMQSLKHWLQILFYSHTERGSDRPSALLQLAATRGKTMENLVSELGDAQFTGKAFMVGIMSLLDVLLSISLPELLSSIALSHEIRGALLSREGVLGKLLKLVEGLENPPPSGIHLTDLPFLTLGDLSKAHADALAWANRAG